MFVRYKLFFIILLTSTLALSDEKPLWELGAGIGALSFPAYRGSDEVRNLMAPVPYFVYRGEFLKADRQGIRGSLFESDRIELVLSLSGSAPVDSDDVELRDGMPDLKTTVEFGPQIDLTLWRDKTHAASLKLRLPARAAYTVEGSPGSAGWIFSPNLRLDITEPPAMQGWNIGITTGPVYASEAQHDYFYGVGEEYATVTRPAYRADSGYSGSQFQMTLSKRFDHTRIGAFIRYDTLSGAVFEESPLVAERNFVAVGFAFVWIFSESGRRVRVDE